MKKCTRCGRAYQEEELSAVEVYDNARNFIKWICGSCALGRPPKRKYGSSRGKTSTRAYLNMVFGIDTDDD